MLIAHLTDLHVRPFGRATNRVVETNLMVERAVRQVAGFAPAAVVITGDLTENGLPEEYAELRRLLEGRLACPVYVVPGNHDRRASLRSALGAWPGVRTDSAFVHYAADIGPLRLIMLDSVVPGAGHGELCSERLAFLERALDAAQDRPVLIGLHHPPFMTGIAAMDAIPLRAPEALLALIARHGRVLAVLCGHHHRVIMAQHGGAMLLAGAAIGGHQSELTFDPAARPYFYLEPGGYFLLRWDGSALTANLATIGDFAGPFPFAVDADYPGRTMA
ncbi:MULTISPECIES: phosphodiesterase [Acidiphilium]|uniref:3',5'-cyclic AMP phosphodiesterase CpdA n=1 Tax=Acidiphilium rubrum TaxID=526 RepID=A0A8G2FGC5_ACIRU|nr:MULTISPECIES: phosphodiesterase [Acidiphilium]SIQ84187.1 3',5'-cyclic AMP phosphodiesterase CpdA [Acidiphilium rubrum]